MTYKHLLLYVDDTPANMRLVEQIIKQFSDIKLIGETTAERGLVVAAEQQPGLILMDIQLPGMDGFQALTELKQNNNTHHIPVIAVSANAKESDEQRGLDHGFDGYLTKPLDLHKFISVIRDQFSLNQD